jgi:hypothetical protein
MAYRKLGPEVKSRILTAIRLGATYELAAKYAGVAGDTLWRYRKDPAFRMEVEKAEGEAVAGWLAVIEQAARAGEWTAAAWKLERRYPHVYGRRVQEIEGTVEHRIPVVFDHDAAVAELTAPALALGPGDDRPPPRPPQGAGDGQTLGQDLDGG